ncbi:GDP-perosamine synthase [Defluviimonas aquaemixtae]|uniref:GDP-perosamine synthase n=1 Tax=Albidovulum aquaemixtae TaxID=1542388 RepID=A0A2R8B2R0_9RHOB|nr:aminotransferase class I/II-fold pyridoxal phosphate-dependent enzyme [Defluviimonas aquaemixtae]SPH16878.1 GDP-perosamine synthase [Defluviimonas aquaemixtae]
MKIPLAIPDLTGNESAYLQECIASSFVSSVGPFVHRFEAEIAELSGSNRAVVVSSGTVALQIALETLGISAGDLVMVPSLTFIASANAVRHSGANVWLVDSGREYWSLDLALCRRLIEDETEQHAKGRRHVASGRILRAIMPVMIMGASVDLEGFAALGREFGLRIVVDAAAAIGAEASGGTNLAKTGVDAVCYSFNGNKTITCGGGGAIAAAEDELMVNAAHLISTGRVGENYEHDIVAYNHRMTNIQAAVGVAQLERLPQFLRRKQEVGAYYDDLAARHSDLSPFPAPPFGSNTRWFSGVWYTGGDLSLCNAFRAHMKSAGVDLRQFWKPVHLQAPYSDALASRMPVAEDLWPRIFPLPCSSGLSAEDLATVVAAADDFWGRNAGRDASRSGAVTAGGRTEAECG